MGEVAARLRVTPKTLEHGQRCGEGPRFVRLACSRVRYRVEEVDGFIAARTQHHTAEGYRPARPSR